ncbi:hypothetical protein PI124_g8339 [Phytophthora idaei]|nr:hypothetical protein PI126_g5024 [Phytophthora idaei]KAG3246933.1 hypothetical protein PI124_g8339 [Phytophthora idaei]
MAGGNDAAIRDNSSNEYQTDGVNVCHRLPTGNNNSQRGRAPYWRGKSRLKFKKYHRDFVRRRHWFMRHRARHHYIRRNPSHG